MSFSLDGEASPRPGLQLSLFRSCNNVQQHIPHIPFDMLRNDILSLKASRVSPGIIPCSDYRGTRSRHLWINPQLESSVYFRCMRLCVKGVTRCCGFTGQSSIYKPDSETLIFSGTKTDCTAAPLSATGNGMLIVAFQIVGVTFCSHPHCRVALGAFPRSAKEDQKGIGNDLHANECR